MTSDTDLPPQADTLQQQPLLIKKKNNPIWKIIFILLLIGNLIFGYYWQSVYTEPFASFVFYPSLLVLSLVNLIALLVYIFKQHPHGPHGKARIIGDIALILASLVLIISGVIIYMLFNL